MMEFNSQKYLFLKGFLFLGIFLLLHYAYDWFPNIFTSLFSGTDESTFEHWKIGFYCYIVLIVFELNFFKVQIERKSDYLAASIFTAILIPWLIFLVWYIAPAVYGPFDSIVVEIIYANISTYTVLLFAHQLQLMLYKIQFEKKEKMIIWVLFGILVMLFTIFTFKKPWADVFIESDF